MTRNLPARLVTRIDLGQAWKDWTGLPFVFAVWAGRPDLEADAIWSDDGIVIHLPDADDPPPADLVMIEPDELEDLVVAELSGSALLMLRMGLWVAISSCTQLSTSHSATVRASSSVITT